MKYKITELYGVSDVAETLGWTKKKVNTYLYSPQVKSFPEPIGRIGGLPIWFKDDVLKYKEERGIL